MSAVVDSDELADLLPGRWAVAATNFPMWTAGDRLEPRFTYELISRDPLVLSDDVTYLRPDGRRKSILGHDRWNNGGFLWRGSGWLRFATSQWQVCGSSADGSVIAIRFSKSFTTPAGVDIVVREGSLHPELRAMIAGATAEFGLSPEDFASFSWLAPAPTG